MVKYKKDTVLDTKKVHSHRQTPGIDVCYWSHGNLSVLPEGKPHALTRRDALYEAISRMGTAIHMQWKCDEWN